jgi:bifunctional DNA-binding transcriptional regulator/antitoxin component of YhaV-PrlF toxin-antitoxin module
MDNDHKIALSRGIRKALGIKPGEKLELTIIGINGAKNYL